MRIHPLLQPIAAAAASLALASAAHALVLVPSAASNDLSNWSCVGVCGALAASEGGSVGLSPAGSAAYGYVATAGSTQYQVDAQSKNAFDPWQDNLGHVGAPADVGGTQAVISPIWLGADPTNKNLTPEERNGSRYTSPILGTVAGQRLQLSFNYVSTDGTRRFQDYAWARLVDDSSKATVAVLFSARSSQSGTDNVVPGGIATAFGTGNIVDVQGDLTRSANVQWAPLGGSAGSCFDSSNTCGYTGWLASAYTVTAADAARPLRLEVGVVNMGDTAYDAGLAFDMQGLAVSAVPEPAAAATLLAGLAGLGLLAARRRSRS